MSRRLQRRGVIIIAIFISLLADLSPIAASEGVAGAYGKASIPDLIEKASMYDGVRIEIVGEVIGDKLRYYPTVTREPFRNQGRLPDLLSSGKLCDDIGLPHLDPLNDRVLICGSPAMLHDLCEMLNGMGFEESPRMGEHSDYAIERAFVEK